MKIKGRVLDKSGIPLIGAKVFVLGSRHNYLTDVDGCFSIEAPRKSLLDIRYYGFKNKTIKSKKLLVVSLKSQKEISSDCVPSKKSINKLKKLRNRLKKSIKYIVPKNKGHIGGFVEFEKVLSMEINHQIKNRG